MITIIDYGVNNIESLKNALISQGVECTTSQDHAFIMQSNSVILPGVGAFGKAMSELQKLGLDRILREFAMTGKPMMGICLGMQLLFDKSHEFGENKGLGILKGEVRQLPKAEYLKLPNIAWAKTKPAKQTWKSTIFDGANEEDYYYVHSFHVVPEDPAIILAHSQYGDLDFCASVKSENIYGCQFHPEKSSAAGLKLLLNFSNLSA
jgi:glutamine amidotransferase